MSIREVDRPSPNPSEMHESYINVTHGEFKVMRDEPNKRTKLSGDPTIDRSLLDVTQGVYPRFIAAEPIRNYGIPHELSGTRFILMKKEWLQRSGVDRVVEENTSVESTDVVLFLRETCKQQIQFIDDSIRLKKYIGVVLGPPGAGKSITAYFKALQLALHEDRIVMWVHIDKSSELEVLFRCICLTSNSRAFTTISSRDELRQLFESNWGVNDATKSRVVFIDGFERGHRDENIITAKEYALRWYKGDRTLRHLFILSPVFSPEILTTQASKFLYERRFKHLPWTFEEYDTAIQNDEFRKLIAPQLGKACCATYDEVVANLRQKFYLAGGCARFMFQYTTEYLVLRLDQIIDQQGNLNSFADYKPGPTQPLVAMFSEVDRCLVSQYVKHCLAKRTGLAPLLDLARHFSTNRSVSGWIFEEFFFSVMWHQRRTSLVLRQGIRQNQVFWRCLDLWHIISPFDPKSTGCPMNQWLRPQRCNQGGFDGVLLRPTEGNQGDAIFVQCTLADTYILNLDLCHEFLSAARNQEIFHATNVLYYFIVPLADMEYFRPITGQNIVYDDVPFEVRVGAVEGWINDSKEKRIL